MEHVEHLAHLTAEAARYRAALSSADLAAPVGACPGWTVADLTEHLCTVHRWSALAVGTPPDGDAPSYQGTPGASLVGWFDAGASGLLETLTRAGADAPCWSMAEPRTAAFWSRRQAHETAIHRWDLEHATGATAPIDPALARDGIAEILDTMLPRQVRLGRLAPTSDWLRLVVGGEELEVASGEHDGPPVATVAGTAEQVLLMLWGRVGIEGLDVEGDPARLAAFLENPLVP